MRDITKASILFLLCLALSQVVLVHADEQVNESYSKGSEPERSNSVECTLCRTTQAFLIEFGFVIFIILSIHFSRWIQAGENYKRKRDAIHHFMQTLLLQAAVILFFYIVSWVGTLLGFTILDPYATLHDCSPVCYV